jgi:two-component system cell cycle sensor histidine kinase/response regulator CckA
VAPRKKSGSKRRPATRARRADSATTPPTEPPALQDDDLLRRATEASPVGLAVVDRAGRITFANARAEAILGLTRSEITQRRYDAPEWRITRYDGSPLPGRELPFARVKATGRPVLGAAHSIEWPDGRRVLLSVNGAPLLDGAGRFDGMVATFEDVTQHELAGAALRESERLLRQSQKVAMLGSYVLDVPRGTWRSSEILDEVFGIDGTHPHDVAGWVAIVHPDERDAMLAYFTGEVVGQRGRFNREYRIVRPRDGVERWVHGLGDLELDAAGNVLRMWGTIQDITDRKRAEQALRDAEDKFSKAFHANPLAMTIISLESRQYLDVNRAWQERTGLGREEARGRTPADLGVFEDPAELDEAVRLARTVGRIEAREVRFRTRRAERRIGLLWAETIDIAGEPCALTVLQDITEQQVNEAALRESEERFRLLSEAAFEGIGVSDHGRIIDCNARLAAMHGYEHAEMIGKSILDFVAPGHAAAVIEHVRSGSEECYEHLARRKDGSLYPVEVQGRALPHRGRVLRVTAVRDITERRRAEEALRKSEEKFSKVFMSAPAGISVSGLSDGRLIEINQEFERLFGYQRNEVLGRTSFELGLWLDPVHRQQILRLLVEAGEVKDLELQLRAKDGRILMVRYYAQTIELEGQSLLLSAFVDITARKQVEEALRRSEEQYRALIDGVRDVIFALSSEGTLTALNPAFEEITGWSREEWLGRPFVGLLHPEDVPEAARLLQRVLRSEPRPTAQLRVRTREGGHRVGEFHTAVQRREGEIVGILGIVRDITDRLALEEQFRQAQKMEAVGQLAGGVAHDFNNLLTVIRSYSDLALDGLPPGDERRGDLEEIREAAKRATVLTRQLLAFSRRQVLRPTVMSLNGVVTGAERLLRRLIGEDIRLVTRLDPALGAVKADAGQIEQVIMNLAVNARDAMPHGGTLIVETANVPLGATLPADLVTIMPSTEYVLLRVTDTGLGMDAETKARLFEPFFTTKEIGKGTGLGLATVYGVVKQSGGYIAVESEPGRGAAFGIYLPRVGETVEGPVAKRPRPDSLRGRETVLLVEDEPAVRVVACQSLRRLGYTVLEAADAQAALREAAAHQGPIAILVTDVVMPGLNGRALADRLQADRPALKVLYVSGYADSAVLQHGALQPGLNFLQKPFALDLLAERVREILDAPAAS